MAATYSLTDFLKEFPSQDACLQYIFEKKYKNAKCPKCERVGQFHRNSALPCFTCNCGKYHLYPRQGTIFADSKLDLQKWFLLLFLASKGTHNAKELESITGISYVTALSIQKRIMELMAANIRDKHHLEQWRSKVKAAYKYVTEENVNLYLSSFQYKAELDTAGKDPFFHLLNIAIGVK